MKQKLRTLAASLGLMTALATPTSADSIYRGVKGPTDWQLDQRLSYSKNEKGIQGLTENTVLKYWDGKEVGKFAFVNVPYRYTDTGHDSDYGFGDVTLGAGPRATIGEFHLLPYLVATFPTGNTHGKITQGNGRIDLRTGIGATYLTTDKQYEVDAAVEFNLTGDNKHKNPPNEVTAGILAGGLLGEHVRAAMGIIGLAKDNGAGSVSSRTALRYIVSPSMHIEGLGDVGIKGWNVPKTKGVTLIVRYNF